MLCCYCYNVYCWACFIIFFFFFSSRRRHTRLTCDWSSDVCSSDLIDAITFFHGVQRFEDVDLAGKLVGVARSEEHTSELQSHVNLVCRLLLEKKKKKKKKNMLKAKSIRIIQITLKKY